MTPKAVLAVAMWISTSWTNRHAPELPIIRERLGQGVTEACAITEWPGPRAELAALLYTVGKHESQFALNVQAGKCGRYQCAPLYMQGVFMGSRARSWWQLERVGAETERWDAIVGLSQEAISQAAYLAAERLRSARYQCADADDVLLATIRAYATSHCDQALPDEGKRLETYESVIRRLL